MSVPKYDELMKPLLVVIKDGNFGFFQALENEGLSVGISWYFTRPDESAQSHKDGRYRIAQKYFECAPELVFALHEISAREGTGHSVEAPDKLQSAETVFLGSDKGLLAKSVKYICDAEIQDYLSEDRL